MSTRTHKDVILWGALGCALVSTAHAEYTLATTAHFNEYVALAVPGALDLYVIRALQQRRDVLVAVLAMVAANVTSHLIAGGVLAVTWHVIAAVGAVAPLIVWRVYSLKYTRTRQELLWGTEAGTDPVAPGAGSAPETDTEEVRVLQGPWRLFPPAPDHVPDSWMEDEYPETHPKTSTVPYLAPVPDLPTEYTASAVHSDSPLIGSDWKYVAGAQEYLEQNGKLTVDGLKQALKIGQSRAQRLIEHMEVER